ncbi:MAG: O-antigen ligase family protein, partial [Myxococcota bacterium]|nr:O-antigen ligase family protein [Myxococcota bacterium]
MSRDSVADLDGLARFRTAFGSGARALAPVVPGAPPAEALPRFPAWYVVALHLAVLLLLWGPPLHFAPPGQEGRDQKGRTAMAAVRSEFTGGALVQVGVAGMVFGLLGLATAASIMRRRPIGLWARCTSGPTAALLVFAAIAACSAVYSPGPLLTLYRAAELAGMVLLFHLIAMSWPGRGAEMLLRLIGGWFLVIGCFNLIAYHLAPDLVTTSAGRLLGGSYFVRDNGLAGLILFVAASARMTQVLSWRSRFGILSWLSQMLLGGYLVWLSGTRAFLLLAPAGFLLLLALRRRLSLGLGVAALVFATTVLYEGMVPQVSQKVQREDERTFDTLSGRTVAWELFVDRWLERPLTGYGYAAGTRTIAVHARMETFAQTHNAYLA